jgi:flagellar basal-body rod protein FlgC
MSGENIPSSVDIAVSGLRAQAMRMTVIATNIANAGTTRTGAGTPYRRQDVVLRTGGGIEGVSIARIAEDKKTDFKRILEPGHPDADTQGYVMMPNVDLPIEMMHLVLASRAYQANTAIMKRYQESVDLTMELLR